MRFFLFSPLPPRPFTPGGVKGSFNSRFGGGAPVTVFCAGGCATGLLACVGGRCGRSYGLAYVPTKLLMQASAASLSPLPAPDVRPSERAQTAAPLPLPTPLERAEQRRIGRIRAGACLSAASLRTTPHKPSSARHPEGARSTARLFFGYFLLAKQKKVARPPGRNPGQSSTNTQNTKDPK